MDNEEEGRLRIERGRQFLKSNWELVEHVQSDQSKGIPAPLQQKPCPEGSRIIDLPAPESLTVGKLPLLEAIRRRRSRRRFQPGDLSLEELSFLLYSTQGIREQGAHRSFRTVPSGGARHSFETYLYIARVNTLGEGLYRYVPIGHRLCLVDSSPGLALQLDDALLGQYWSAAVVFVWTTVPYRMEWRYSVVSHKIIAIDAGHVCQNLYLACESIGCGTCAIGAYDQKKMDRLLGVDGNDEFTIYAAPVGRVLPGSPIVE